VPRIILVSTDSHAAAASLDAYRPYLEERYHAALDEHIEAEQESLDRYGQFGKVQDEASLEAVDDQGAIRSGGRLGAHDLDRRIQEMDREGVVAELVNPVTSDGNTSCIPAFCSHVSAAWSAELRGAGSRAYNRWLADLIAASDGRLLGVAEPGPCLDLSATVAELEWAADHGFVAVQMPGVVGDAALPRLFDAEYYERFWSACEDLGLVLNVHAGWGIPQMDLTRIFVGKLGGDLTVGFDLAEHVAEANRLILEKRAGFSNFVAQLDSKDAAFVGGVSPQAREPLWQLMLGGVFDRHPELRLTITELRADWLPATLAALDGYVSRGDTPLKLKPSEYFVQNCRVTPSFTHPAEVLMRHAIGVGQTMFGRDYPHPEGTWPNTWDWIRAAFAGVPEDEARLILGENAIDWYGLDRLGLEKFAETIGPLPEEILGDHIVDPRKIQSFDKRGGYSKPAERVNTAVVLRAFEADLAMAGVTRA
jgi:predicted TIM-barrel fold metal-dependent hydrolase